ncbi:MAG: DegT/DnrJ/EryC1/StrS family aminotransferase [Alphaproteobacteria bacterium]
MSDLDKFLAGIRDNVGAYCEAADDTGFDPDNPVLRLHEPTFGADEIMAAVETLLSTRVTMGPKAIGFEKEFSAAFGHGFGVMNNSGSSANLLAIAALCNADTEDALKPGDEVIVSALSWATTVWPLIQYGLVPVIVDIDPATLNMDAAGIEAAIGPKTRAVMPVHVYGNPCDMDAMVEVCNRRGLILIEDCCEALGAAYDGTPVGRFGRVGTFSFYFSHHMTTLEGGICVCDDADLADLMRILRAHGWTRDTDNPEKFNSQYPDIDPRFLFVNLGYNLRPTEVQGAMGSVQLPKLAGFVDARRVNAAHWTADFAAYGDVLTLQTETPKGYHSWFGFPVTVKAGAPFKVADLREFLEQSGIETRPLICGNIAEQPALKRHAHRVSGDLKHSSHVMDNAISFGCHQSVDAAARAYVSDRFRDFMSKNS